MLFLASGSRRLGGTKHFYIPHRASIYNYSIELIYIKWCNAASMWFYVEKYCISQSNGKPFMSQTVQSKRLH